MRPLVLGGCCCAHVGAIRGLAERAGRLAVVWFDAHGDLNTPETSPSGNTWGMPLRMAIDAGSVEARRRRARRARATSTRRRSRYIGQTGIDDDIDRALDGCDRVYVAFDCDVLRPGELSVFMPEPGGPTLAEAEAVLRETWLRSALWRASG